VRGVRSDDRVDVYEVGDTCGRETAGKFSSGIQDQEWKRRAICRKCGEGTDLPQRIGALMKIIIMAGQRDVSCKCRQGSVGRFEHLAAATNRLCRAQRKRPGRRRRLGRGSSIAAAKMTNFSRPGSAAGALANRCSSDSAITS